MLNLFQHPIKSTSQETLKESAEEECRLQGSKIQGDKIGVFQRPRMSYIHSNDKNGISAKIKVRYIIQRQNWFSAKIKVKEFRILMI
jgi:hypothetical protein